MNKLAIAISILCAAIISLLALQRSAQQTRASSTAQLAECNDISNRITGLHLTLENVRGQVQDRHMQSKRESVRPKVTAEMRALLAAKTGAPPATTLVRLQEQLDAGWNSSPDFVLVSKPTLERINLQSLSLGGQLTSAATAILAISSSEASQIATAVKQARIWTLDKAERADPAGDIVARYRIPADGIWEQTVSNSFSSGIAGILGDERASLFLKQAWRVVKSGMPSVGEEPATLIVRRTGVGDESDLLWEMRQGDSLSSANVRYGAYPSAWFLKLFPGGWTDLAAREGFPLPKNFRQ